MKAIIFVAGYATRLRPLTYDIPKALLKIGGEPILQKIINKIEKIEQIDQIYIVSNDKFYSHFQKWSQKLNTNKQITVLNDGTTNNENRLGAFGDIMFPIEKDNITDDIIAIAGDNLFEFELKDMITQGQQKNSSILAVRDLKDKNLIANRLGCVQIDENNKIINFLEKPQNPPSTLAATAIYYFKKENLKNLKKYQTDNPNLDNCGEIIKLLIQDDNVYTYNFEDKWFDIGKKEHLHEIDKLYGGKGKYTCEITGLTLNYETGELEGQPEIELKN